MRFFVHPSVNRRKDPDADPGGDSASMVIGEQVTNLASITNADNLILVNEDTGEVVGIDGVGIAPEQNVVPMAFADTVDVLWALRHQTGDDYIIRSSGGGRDLGSESAAEGANVRTNQGDGAEEWVVTSVGGNLYSIVHKTHSKALTRSGTNLVQADYTGADAQKWRIHHAETDIVEEPNFEMIGWATREGGTTGGAGGDVVTVSTPTEYMNAVCGMQHGSTPAPRPRIVEVYNGVIDLNTIDLTDWSSIFNQWGDRCTSSGGTNVRVRPDGDLSIIGLGPNSEIRGQELRLGMGGTQGPPVEGNFIIRNLKLLLDAYKTIPSISEPAIVISSQAGYIWIDHCTFEDDPDHPDPDGGIDILRGARYITISWNVFNKGKVNLWGSDSGSSEDMQSLHLTANHNWWPDPDPRIGTRSRVPNVYVGWRMHLLNNYWTLEEGNGGGRPGNRDNDVVRVIDERGYKEDGTNGWEIQASAVELNWGRWDRNQVISRRRGTPHEEWALLNTGVGWDPHNEYEYTPNHPLSVPRLVTDYAGRGKGPFAP